jgi:hypothetical protein
MNIINYKWSPSKRLCAISALSGAYYLLSAMVLPIACAQEQIIINEGKSGSERLLTYRYKISQPAGNSGTSGISPDFLEASGKVFEFNVSATCSYESSVSHTVTVGFKDISNYGKTYVKSAIGGNLASIMTRPVVGFNAEGSTPAFSVECSTEDSVPTSIEVIALGRVIDTTSETDEHPRTHKKSKNGQWN